MYLKKFIPDYYFKDIYLIPPDFFVSRGIRGIICDIDNTLVTYDDPEPTPELLNWISNLEKQGVTVSFVSNNNKERVELFNSKLHFFAVPKSGKPSRKGLLAAMSAMGTDTLATASIGDQLFTDVLAAKRVGITSVLVYPIKDKRTLFFRFKRLLEKPFMHWFFKHNNMSKN